MKRSNQSPKSKIADSSDDKELAPVIIRAAREHLRELMSGISEDHYCAGWLTELEFVLWAAIQQHPKPLKFGFREIESARVEELKDLSAALGGWWRWDEEDRDEVWVPLEQWEKFYAAKTEKAQNRADV